MNTVVPKRFDKSVGREGKVQTRELIERLINISILYIDFVPSMIKVAL